MFTLLSFADWAVVSHEICYIFLGPEFEHRLGDHAGLILGKRMMDFVHSEDRSDAMKKVEAHLRAKEPTTDCVQYVMKF